MYLCNSNLTKTCKVLINLDSFEKRKTKHKLTLPRWYLIAQYSANTDRERKPPSLFCQDNSWD